IELRKLQPAPAHAARDLAVADRRADRLEESVGERQLLLLEFPQYERAADAQLHGMEVAELASGDLVHPHPLPGRSHAHDLLGHVLERAHPLAPPLEPLRGAPRQATD